MCTKITLPSISQEQVLCRKIELLEVMPEQQKPILRGFSFELLEVAKNGLFNLGTNPQQKSLDNEHWIYDFLEALNDVSGIELAILRNKPYYLHPVKWKDANVKKPAAQGQAEWWQFRLNKSKGRIIGLLVKGIFYVVWLDKHHNFCDSDGYGKACVYRYTKSSFEMLSEEILRMKETLSISDEMYCEFRNDCNFMKELQEEGAVDR